MLARIPGVLTQIHTDVGFFDTDGHGCGIFLTRMNTDSLRCGIFDTDGHGWTRMDTDGHGWTQIHTDVFFICASSVSITVHLWFLLVWGKKKE